MTSSARLAEIARPAQDWLVTFAKHRRGCQRARCARAVCDSCVCSCGLDAAVSSALDLAAALAQEPLLSVQSEPVDR